MRWKPLIRAVCPCLGILAAGCGLTSEGPQLDDGVVAIQFSDIPVPAGMKLRERFHESDSLETGRYRYGDFVYVGLVPIPDVSEYMRERMPQHRWKLEKRKQADHEETLRFRRGIHVVDCELSRDQVDTVMKLRVRTETAHR